MKEYDATLYIPGTPFEMKGKVSFPDMKNGIPKGKMVAITVDVRKMKKRLCQELNTQDDSFTYTVSGESEPTYLVDCHADLIDCKRGKVIGRFKLSSGDSCNQWHLYIDDVLFMSGPPNGLFKLPEFELDSLTALINRKG